MYRVRHLQDRHVHSTRKVGSSPMEGCLACDLSEGRMYLPGALIAETEGWRVEHTVGPLGVGTLIVKPKRHVVHVAGLSSQEAAELGPLIRQAAAVVTELTDPERSTSHLGRMPMLIPDHITGWYSRSPGRRWTTSTATDPPPGQDVRYGSDPNPRRGSCIRRTRTAAIRGTADRHMTSRLLLDASRCYVCTVLRGGLLWRRLASRSVLVNRPSHRRATPRSTIGSGA